MSNIDCINLIRNICLKTERSIQLKLKYYMRSK